MRQQVDHPSIGTVEMPGAPMYFSRTPVTIRRHPPRLGEHNDEVIREYGYQVDDLARLRELGAIPNEK